MGYKITSACPSKLLMVAQGTWGVHLRVMVAPGRWGVHLRVLMAPGRWGVHTYVPWWPQEVGVSTYVSWWPQEGGEVDIRVWSIHSSTGNECYPAAGAPVAVPARRSVAEARLFSLCLCILQEIVSQGSVKHVCFPFTSDDSQTCCSLQVTIIVGTTQSTLIGMGGSC